MAEWQKLSTGVVNVDQLQAQVDAVSDVISAIGAILQAIATALDLLKELIFDVPDPLGALLDKLRAALESLILDFFQNNVAVAVHVNLNWNPDWVYERTPQAVQVSGSATPDWVNDGVLPFQGTGMRRWLMDIAASTFDVSDPFRPLTDADTRVSGVMFVKGVPGTEPITNLKEIFKVFTNFKDFESAFSDDLLKDTSEEMRSLFRLGAASFDETLVGIANSSKQFRADLKDLFTLGVDEIDGYVPKAGNYPKWASVPLSDLLPPTGPLFSALRSLIDLLKVSGGIKQALEDLAEALVLRAQLLAAIAEDLNELLDLLVGLLAFFEESYVIVLDSPTGGMAKFTLDALQAEGLPDFGEEGVVVGMVAIATLDDPANHLESLFDLFGIKLDEVSAAATERTDALSDTWDDLFP